jgi:hypothetical protein
MIERLDEALEGDDPSPFEPETFKLTPRPVLAQLFANVAKFGESGIMFIELGKRPKAQDTMLGLAVP